MPRVVVATTLAEIDIDPPRDSVLTARIYRVAPGYLKLTLSLAKSMNHEIACTRSVAERVRSLGIECREIDRARVSGNTTLILLNGDNSIRIDIW